MWSLKNPMALIIWLGLLPVLIYLTHFRKERGGVITFNLDIWNENPFSPRFNPARVLHTFFWLLTWTGYIMLAVATTSPIVIDKQNIYLTRGIDMVILLDESPSMSAQDFKPKNRFGAAKKVITDFTHARENDQIGLVTFSSYAMLRVPPTFNYDFLLKTLNELEIAELGKGTAIGDGIATAALHLKSSTAREKIIILITDGVNNEGELSPEEAAALAYSLGIRIYTIGIGRESEKRWEYTDTETGITYTPTSGEFNEKLLNKIAEEGGGKYFYAGKPQALSYVFEEIDSIEKTEKIVKISVNQIPKHNIFIIWGLIFTFTGFAARKLLLKEII